MIGTVMKVGRFVWGTEMLIVVVQNSALCDGEHDTGVNVLTK